MAHRISFTDDQDDTITKLTLKLQNMSISRDDIEIMDVRKKELALKLVSLETEKVEIMKRLELELSQIDRNVLEKVEKKAELLRMRGGVMNQIEADEVEARNFGLTIGQKQQKLRQLTKSIGLMKEQKQISLKDHRIFEEQNRVLKIETSSLQKQRSFALNKLQQLQINISSETRNIINLTQNSSTIQSQIIRNNHEKTILTQQLKQVSDQILKTQNILESSKIQNRNTRQQLQSNETKHSKLTQSLNQLKRQEDDERTRQSQQKQTYELLMNLLQNKKAQFKNLKNNNEELNKQESQLKKNINSKQALVRTLQNKSQQLDAANRLVRMQLDAMKLQDMTVKNMIDLKWKDYQIVGDTIKQQSRLYNKSEVQSELRERQINTLKLHSLVSTESGASYFKNSI